MKKVVILILLALFSINPTIAKQKNHDDTNDFMVIEENNSIQNTKSSEKTDNFMVIDEHNSDVDSETHDNINDNSQNEQVENSENNNSANNVSNQNDSNAIQLDISDSSKHKLKRNKINSNNSSEDINLFSNNDFRISPQNVNQYRNYDIYSKKTNSFSKEKKCKDITFGTKYDNTFTPNQMEQSRTLFSKYQKDKFAFTTSYKNNSLGNFNQQFRGTFSFSPEYQINKYLTLQGIYSKNVLDKSNKNEVIFSLKPFKDDRMDFNVGASQIYYEDATPMRSQFNFATKFKF